jgi:hypothetical protein
MVIVLVRKERDSCAAGFELQCACASLDYNGWSSSPPQQQEESENASALM